MKFILNKIPFRIKIFFFCQYFFTLSRTIGKKCCFFYYFLLLVFMILLSKKMVYLNALWHFVYITSRFSVAAFSLIKVPISAYK